MVCLYIYIYVCVCVCQSCAHIQNLCSSAPQIGHMAERCPVPPSVVENHRRHQQQHCHRPILRAFIMNIHHHRGTLPLRR